MKVYELQIGFADPRLVPYRDEMIRREINYKQNVIAQHGYDRLVVIDLGRGGRRSEYLLLGGTWVDGREWRAMLRDA